MIQKRQNILEDNTDHHEASTCKQHRLPLRHLHRQEISGPTIGILTPHHHYHYQQPALLAARSP